MQLVLTKKLSLQKVVTQSDCSIGQKVSLCFAAFSLDHFQRLKSVMHDVWSVDCVYRRHPTMTLETGVGGKGSIELVTYQSSTLRGKYSYSGSASSVGLLAVYWPAAG